VFHLDVAKVDLMLHILQQDSSARAACCICWVSCMRVKRRGMEAEARGPACMRAQEAKGRRRLDGEAQLFPCARKRT
jgi:hypothetical protein